MLDPKQIKPGITKSQLILVDPTSALDPATKQYTDNLIQQSIYNQDWKASVRAATTTNITLTSPGAAIDGVTLNSGDRVLVKNQTTPSQNGIYVFASSSTAMVRSQDADSSSEVTPAMAVSVEEGTSNGLTSWKLTTTGAIVVGTTSLTFALLAVFVAPLLTTNNKDVTCSTTVNDGDQACATGIAGTPTSGSVVMVFINGVAERLGDGVKTKSCYFSADTGTTPKAWSAIAAGDKLYWVGSIAGYQLAATDTVTFLYTN